LYDGVSLAFGNTLGRSQLGFLEARILQFFGLSKESYARSL